MNYKEELPEFMAKNVTNLVNKRFDITEIQCKLPTHAKRWDGL